MTNSIPGTALFTAIIGIDGTTTTMNALLLLVAATIWRALTTPTLLVLTDHPIAAVGILTTEFVLFHRRLAATGDTNELSITVLVITAFNLGSRWFTRDTYILLVATDLTIWAIGIVGTTLKSFTAPFAVTSRRDRVSASKTWARGGGNTGCKNNEGQCADPKTRTDHSLLRFPWRSCPQDSLSMAIPPVAPRGPPRNLTAILNHSPLTAHK